MFNSFTMWVGLSVLQIKALYALTLLLFRCTVQKSGVGKNSLQKTLGDKDPLYDVIEETQKTEEVVSAPNQSTTRIFLFQ